MRKYILAPGNHGDPCMQSTNIKSMITQGPILPLGFTEHYKWSNFNSLSNISNSIEKMTQNMD